ncbi:uncharacterized protein TRAVEDRAFT_51548 [Trametes versicolor FP-101664 SS1]|uniref:uncharacterized protein n=1 Tax=Trametes versicolor (strain FP-101664) TaxID=717944 RepID=UPI00046212C9|nr:uncharacterized protein TRAVEDRAFT_51548 [Trametes versicolor FP-101664 SS1]EIW55427.1 hypothetical protein TRAVEDRAFT_51548 [Trametes versicolor FP-101664 SS1]
MAARSDRGAAPKRKSVTSSITTENVDSGNLKASKKPKVAATLTGLRAGWDTPNKSNLKGKSTARSIPTPTPRKLATTPVASARTTPASRTAESARKPAAPKPTNVGTTKFAPEPVDADAGADTAAADAGGLNDYGGLQDEDDTVEAAAVAPVPAATWQIQGLQSESSDSDDDFPADNLTHVAHVPANIVGIVHRPTGQSGANRRRWNTSDLEPEIRHRFTHELIPLTRATMSTLLPWYSLTTDERQALFNRVFPTYDHVIEMNNRITEWQGKFAAAALHVLEAHFVKAGMAEPEVRATFCRIQLGTHVAAMKAPFLWRVWEDGKKKGCLQGEFVLGTFGLVHIPVLQAVPLALRQGEGESDLRPSGALILAALAVECALNVWLTGQRIIPQGHAGHFSADNWGDKTVVSRGVAKSSTKVANMFARAKSLSFEHWITILDVARDRYRLHKAVQDRQAITIESASEEAMTNSDAESE